MASKDEKLLKALRSLSPPKPGAGGDPPQEPPRLTGLEDGAEGRPDRRRRGISLSIEEVGVFFLAAVVLVVLAFLMGWYGRGLAWPGGRSSEGAGGRPGGAPRALLSIESTDASDVGTQPSGVRKPPPARELFTIVVMRLPLRDNQEAEGHRRFIEERGLTPAWCTPTELGIELRVGRFDSPHDPLAKRWLVRIRTLRETYRSAQIMKIRRRSKSDMSTG